MKNSSQQIKQNLVFFLSFLVLFSSYRSVTHSNILTILSKTSNKYLNNPDHSIKSINLKNIDKPEETKNNFHSNNHRKSYYSKKEIKDLAKISPELINMNLIKNVKNHRLSKSNDSLQKNKDNSSFIMDIKTTRNNRNNNSDHVKNKIYKYRIQKIHNNTKPKNKEITKNTDSRDDLNKNSSSLKKQVEPKNNNNKDPKKRQDAETPTEAKNIVPLPPDELQRKASCYTKFRKDGKYMTFNLNKTFEKEIKFKNSIGKDLIMNFCHDQMLESCKDKNVKGMIQSPLTCKVFAGHSFQTKDWDIKNGK